MNLMLIYSIDYTPSAQPTLRHLENQSRTSWGGGWTLLSTRVIDTGWQNYTNFNANYYNTTAGLTAYSFNGWRIKDNTLWISLALKAASLANLNFVVVCYVPVKNVNIGGMVSKQDGTNVVLYNNRHNQAAAVQLVAQDNNAIIQLNTPSNFAPQTLVASGSCALAPGFSITDGQTYPTEYTWQRVS